MKHFSKIFSWALFAILLIPTVSFAANPPVITPSGVLYTTTGYTANFKMTTAPSSPTKLYAAIANVDTNSWVQRDIYLLEVDKNTPTPLAFDVAFNFNDLGIQDNVKYAYYIGGPSSEEGVFYTTSKCFTTGGTVACAGTSNTSNATTPATTTTSSTTSGTTSNATVPAPGTVIVPTNPTVGSGTGTASFSPTGTSSGILVEGKCGPVSGTTTSVITSTSANLCEKGNVTGFTGSGPWTWSCAGANGGGTKPCSAEVATDEDLGDNFLKNPLAPGLDTFPKIFAAVVNNIILPIAVPFLAIMFIYAGFLFVEARGKPEKLTQAKETLKYTFIGAGLVLGAFVIANALQATVGQLLS
jgi:hypothetical protein